VSGASRVIAPALALILLAGCSDDRGDEDPGAEAGLTVEEGAFLEGMHHHHAQAIQLATAVVRNGSDERVGSVALDVAVSQAREQGQIEALLATEGVTASGEAGGDLPGMIPTDDLAAALQLRGPELDARFVELMVPHHEGAVTMAAGVLADEGTSDVVRDLAGAITTSQQEELTELGLLRQ
jgi:uncharacterized protein (DUF305 family)